MVEILLSQGWIAEPQLRVGKIQIRSDDPIAPRLQEALQLTPPDAPNRQTQRRGLACATFAPGEWLLTGTDPEVSDARERVRKAFAEDLCLVTDLSAGRFCSLIYGPQALRFLSAYSPIDFGAAAFTAGATARTQLGDIGLFVAKLDDKPTFRLIIEQSMSAYFRHLLSRSHSFD